MTTPTPPPSSLVVDRRAPAQLVTWKSPIVWLAFLITIGFFAALFLQMLYTQSNPDMMLGALMAAFSGIVGYWFGSSSTSAAKDHAINDLTKTAAVVASTAQATQVASDAAAGAGTQAAHDVQIQADQVTVQPPKD